MNKLLTNLRYSVTGCLDSYVFRKGLARLEEGGSISEKEKVKVIKHSNSNLEPCVTFNSCLTLTPLFCLGEVKSDFLCISERS